MHEPPGVRATLTRLQRLSLQGTSWLMLERGLLACWAQHAAATLTCLVITRGGIPLDWQRTSYSGHDPCEGPQHAGMLAPLACLRALRGLALDGAPMCPRLELHVLEGPHGPACSWRVWTLVCLWTIRRQPSKDSGNGAARVLASQHTALPALLPPSASLISCA